LHQPHHTISAGRCERASCGSRPTGTSRALPPPLPCHVCQASGRGGCAESAQCASWCKPRSAAGMRSKMLGSGVRVPPSPPPLFDSAEVLLNQAFLEPPENDGVAPRWSTAVTQIAIFETPVKGESIFPIEPHVQPGGSSMLARVPDLAVEPLKVAVRERRLEKMRRGHCISSR